MDDVLTHFGGGVWDPCFARWLNYWEVFDVERFFQRFQRRRVCSGVEDHVVWTKSKDEIFIVKSLYKALELKRQGDFSIRVIWN